MKYLGERQRLIDIALQMNQCGLNQGTAGNISLRVDEGFLITPSGIPYPECEAQHMVLMGLDGEPLAEAGPQLAPSSEWRFHRDIYVHRSDAGAVLHAHSDWCTTVACMGRALPAFHYMIAVAGGDTVRCAPYATFGTQALSDYALQALHDRRACLLENHGLLCLHDDLTKVLALAIEVEHLAKIYCQLLQVGELRILGRNEMQKVLKKFKTYGAQETPQG